MPKGSKGAYKNRKIGKVMGEYKRGKLHSGRYIFFNILLIFLISKHGPIVHSRKQAVAIAMSEARRRKKR